MLLLLIIVILLAKVLLNIEAFIRVPTDNYAQIIKVYLFFFHSKIETTVKIVT